MLFDLSQIKLNRLRAKRIGKKNFLLKLACKNLEGRVAELGSSFKRVMVVGAKETDFPKLDQKLAIEYYDHFDQSFIKEKFDLILNVLDLHWSNNPKEDLSIQMDFLKTGGVFVGCLYGTGTLNELRDSFFKAELKISGEAHPRISPLPEIRDIGNLAQNVGMKRVVADKELITLHYKGVRELLKNLRAMGETNSVLGRKKTFSRRDVFDLMEKYYKKNYPYEKAVDNKYEIRATFEIIYLYGEKNK